MNTAATLAAALLALLGATYYVTYQPAPHVMVQWREGVTAERRAAIERRFGLLRARDPENRAFSYDLVDVRSDNIEELLEQPEIERTGYIDEWSYVVPSDVPYGRGGMWIGDRIPEIRVYRVMPVVLTVCGSLIGYALVKHVAARQKRMRRLLAFVAGWRRPRFAAAGREHPRT